MKHSRIRLVLIFLLSMLLSFALGREQSKRFDVVFTGDFDTSGAALDHLITVIAYGHAYGDRDNALEFPAALNRLNEQALEQQCGEISTTARDLLIGAGYRVRLVAMLTADEWNDCDNGHTALEVWHPDFEQWLLVDFSTDRLYYRTVEEFVQERGIYRRLTTAPLAVGYTFPCANSPFNESIDVWYDRVAQIPLIYDGVFYADANHPLAHKAIEYGYTVIPDWNSRFYTP